MAVIGTLVTSQPSSVGWWSECTLATAQAVTGTSTATHTIVYSNTSSREFQPSCPLGAIFLSPGTATSAAGSAYSTLQNGTNTLTVAAGANAGIGLVSAIIGGTAQQTNTSTGLISYTETGTLSLTFVNAGATGTLTAGTRLGFVQWQGN